VAPRTVQRGEGVQRWLHTLVTYRVHLGQHPRADDDGKVSGGCGGVGGGGGSGGVVDRAGLVAGRRGRGILSRNEAPRDEMPQTGLRRIFLPELGRSGARRAAASGLPPTDRIVHRIVVGYVF